MVTLKDINLGRIIMIDAAWFSCVQAEIEEQKNQVVLSINDLRKEMHPIIIMNSTKDQFNYELNQSQTLGLIERNQVTSKEFN